MVVITLKTILNEKVGYQFWGLSLTEGYHWK